MYSPMFNDGEEYDPCDVDVCNGMMVGGHYSYVSTMFHPYYMGCYGPGYDSDYAQQCSRNPRICGDIATIHTYLQCSTHITWVVTVQDMTVIMLNNAPEIQEFAVILPLFIRIYNVPPILHGLLRSRI